MATATPFDYARDQCRRFDPERYFCLLFAPEAARAGLFALYAFNLEIAKLREIVREPMAGEIRLHWWRETIEGLYRGAPAPAGHVIAGPLAAAIECHRPPRELFEALIEARRLDLADEPPANLAAFESYIDATAGGLQCLALALLGVRDETAARAARLAGTAFGLIGVLRAFAFHRRQGRVLLPRELITAEGLNIDDLLRGQSPPGLARMVERIATRAGEQVEEARSLAHAVPRAALPALLPARLVDLHRGRLARAGFDPLAPRFEAATLRRQWRILNGALAGRF